MNFKLGKASIFALAVGVVFIFGAGFGLGKAAETTEQKNGYQMEEKTGKSQEFQNEEGAFDKGSFKNEKGGFEKPGKFKEDMLTVLKEKYGQLSDEQKKTIETILGLKETDIENLDEEKMDAMKEKISTLSDENKTKLKEIFKDVFKKSDKTEKTTEERIAKIKEEYKELSDENKKKLETELGLKAADVEALDEEKLNALMEKVQNLSDENKTELKDLLKELGFRNSGRRSNKEDVKSSATDSFKENSKTEESL